MNRSMLKTQLQEGRRRISARPVRGHSRRPKVKMVPAGALDDVADVGAGFAGGAVWGMGQNAASHDMMARIDPASYTPLPWKPGLARFAADLYVDGRPHPYCPRVNLKRVLGRAARGRLRLQRRRRAGAFPGDAHRRRPRPHSAASIFR